MTAPWQHHDASFCAASLAGATTILTGDIA